MSRRENGYLLIPATKFKESKAGRGNNGGDDSPITAVDPQVELCLGRHHHSHTCSLRQVECCFVQVVVHCVSTVEHSTTDDNSLPAPSTASCVRQTEVIGISQHHSTRQVAGTVPRV
ncbi:hypothetical protein V1264_022285 [Littorina saxatilis]|uniref:Uncharacterized protein n=1 Tax=Littorina saxatilis TaxID=31220 RepID=A0AAN9AK19_9CAEN